MSADMIPPDDHISPDHVDGSLDLQRFNWEDDGIESKTVKHDLKRYTWEGKWNEVIKLYRTCPESHKLKISDESCNTALHVAIDLDENFFVKKLVDEITLHETKALEEPNVHGDTPLHIAASRGFTKICEYIIGKNKERIYLLEKENEKGETPLFQAALYWKKQTFAYLAHISKEWVTINHLQRKDGDNILHTAIRGEYFDLAVIICHYYKWMGFSRLNNNEFTPLKILATRPSGFKSSCNFTWYQRILYNCILVEKIDTRMISNMYESESPPNFDKFDPTRRSNLYKSDASPKFPENYTTLCDFVSMSLRAINNLLRRLMKSGEDSNDGKNVSSDTENPPEKDSNDGKNVSKKKLSDTENPPEEDSNDGENVPEKKLSDTPEKDSNDGKNVSKKKLSDRVFIKLFICWLNFCHQDKEISDGFLPPNYKTFHLFIRSAFVYVLGLFGEGLMDVTIAKKKHIWCSQLLEALMEQPYEAFTGAGSRPPGYDPGDFMSNFFFELPEEEEGEKHEESNEGGKPKKEDNSQEEDENKIMKQKSYTPFLVAARYGIVELVKLIKEKIPSSIHDTNSKNENVLLVAVKYKKPLIVKTLPKITKEDIWNNLWLAIDKEENTVLHLAAYQSQGSNKPWRIVGSALQMTWEIKWFQCIKGLVPPHFSWKSNKKGKTSVEIFTETHSELIKVSSDWLKDTSESCSVVAALVAGVSFATAGTVPGGNSTNGTPVLEGQLAFDVFAFASLIGLCFSVTGLIMFLSILTSRKEAKDFLRDLPLKLLLGLSSLFVAITSMIVAFCTGHFFLLSHRLIQSVLFAIYVAACFPVTYFAIVQFPLYVDLLTAIIFEIPEATDKGDHL